MPPEIQKDQFCPLAEGEGHCGRLKRSTLLLEANRMQRHAARRKFKKTSFARSPKAKGIADA
jgi:hypothetical protein